MGKRFLSLPQIVDISILQNILNKFADATGLAAVVVDRNGVPVTQPSNFTRFCNIIRNSKKGSRRCMLSDAHGGIKAKEKGGPYIYQCHAGLIDLAAPIIVKGEFIGTILCGQVILTEEARRKDVKQTVYQRIQDLDVDRDRLMFLFNKIEAIPKSRVHAAAELLSIAANYIVEMGAANIFQQELIEEIKMRRELEQLLRNMELKALQSQINPHFLFNTLNTIARLALLEGASQTEDVTYALADLMRYSLRNIEEIVTLEKELDCVRKYLLIQKVRFKDRIKTNIDFNKELLSTPIPLLTLQPVVENAIVHGLELKKKDGEINIRGSRNDNKVVIEVHDNGVGISEAKLKNIFSKKQITEKGHTTGLGLVNVHKRLQHYFGPEFGINIESMPGVGTWVKIIIPYKNSISAALKRNNLVW